MASFPPVQPAAPPHRGRHVRRRGFVHRGGAAVRAGGGGDRGDAEAVRRLGHQRQHRRPLLHPAGHRRRPVRRRPAGLRPLRARRERGVLPGGDRRLRLVPCPGAHAQPLRPLQRASEVRAAGPVRPRGRGPGAGHRALRPTGPGRRRGHTAAPGGRPGQGPGVFPVRGEPDAAAVRALPAGGHDQDRGAGPRPPAAAAELGQARLAADLLHPRRRPQGVRRSATAAPAPRATSSTRRATCWANTAAPTSSPSASARACRPWAAPQPRFVLRIDAGTGQVHVGPRSLLGRRDIQVSDTRWLQPRHRLHESVPLRRADPPPQPIAPGAGHRPGRRRPGPGDPGRPGRGRGPRPGGRVLPGRRGPGRRLDQRVSVRSKRATRPRLRRARIRDSGTMVAARRMAAAAARCCSDRDARPGAAPRTARARPRSFAGWPPSAAARDAVGAAPPD